MPASSNSRDAYGAHVLAGRAASQRERILALLRTAKRPMTRREIAKYFSFPAQDGGPVIELSAVCGRVNSMLPDPAKDKSGLVRKAYKDQDPRTGQKVDYLEAVPLEETVQMRLTFPWPFHQHQEVA